MPSADFGFAFEMSSASQVNAIPRHAQIYYPPSLFVVLFQFLYKFIVLRGAFDWGFALTSRSHCRRNARSQREERRHKHRHGEAKDLHKPHSGFEAWQRDSRCDGPTSTVLKPVFVASSTRPASFHTRIKPASEGLGTVMSWTNLSSSPPTISRCVTPLHLRVDCFNSSGRVESVYLLITLYSQYQLVPLY